MPSNTNDSIRVEGLLLPSPIVGEGLGVRAIELWLHGKQALLHEKSDRHFG
ncbi:MAG: hypothetical protein AAF974_07905 [Cyanobacteria bacterium P01_E01_bin.34]